MTSELPELLSYLTPLERAELDRLLTLLARRKAWRELARPNQLAPEGSWRIWLILAGRGFGKTRSIVEWACEQAKKMPGSRGAVVARTAADNRDILIEGESGFMAMPDDYRPVHEPSKRRLTWSNGSTATIFSADEPAALRGPQYHWAMCDELAAWKYPEAWDMLMLGLRLGRDPRVAVATTPKPTPLIKKLLKNPAVHVTRGTTYDNRANLAPAFFEEIIVQYEGTRLGRQELNAELLDDAPGALWKRSDIDATRVARAPALKRVVVGLDPPATSGESSAEAGIVGVGLGEDDEYYVLDDRSLRASPDGWGRQAVALYHSSKANRIVAEINQGGEMVTAIIRTVDKLVPVRTVRATRGKAVRAEPVAALYEQHRVHHVGSLGTLEDQMCSWEPGVGDSPDRVDALVWALTDLMVRPPQRAAGSRQG